MTKNRTARFVGPNAKRQAMDFLEHPTRVMVSENWVRGALVVEYYEAV